VWAEWIPPLSVYFYATLEDYEGDGAEYEVITAPDNNSTITSLPVSPARTGYVFKRWAYKDTGGTIQQFTAATRISSDMHVWAEWIPLLNVYFYASLEDYQGGGAEYKRITAVVSGTTINSLPASPTRTDYVFKRWAYKDAGGTIQEFTASTTITVAMYVWAEWTRKNVPIIGAELDDREWATGSVNSSSTTQYHYFYATEGSSYTVRWNDRFQGDGTKTGGVEVYAYWYDTNTSIFSDAVGGYTNGMMFTASKTGYVMLRVARYYSSSYNGTYAITYQ
jgi:hypothetical protein